MGSRNKKKRDRQRITGIYTVSQAKAHIIVQNCECFNVNKMLCLKGAYVPFLPEQDTKPGHNWTSAQPKQDSDI